MIYRYLTLFKQALIIPFCTFAVHHIYTKLVQLLTILKRQRYEIELFPMMKEQLRIADLCRKIGLAIESIKSLFEGKSLTAKSFSFFSPEHNQKFTAEDVRLEVEKEPDNPNKLRLNLNGVNILDWFRQKYQEFQKAIGIHIKPKKDAELAQNKGIKL
ncbi:hypothetical protein EZS27_032769 [termite gut metagenome]|uniref:Uncharacterized protein n=1 Tax=termite gut metagenome TaxID=433724 RepID=A0A5J4Q617_9ZZZZ